MDKATLEQRLLELRQRNFYFNDLRRRIASNKPIQLYRAVWFTYVVEDLLDYINDFMQIQDEDTIRELMDSTLTVYFSCVQLFRRINKIYRNEGDIKKVWQKYRILDKDFKQNSRYTIAILKMLDSEREDKLYDPFL